MESAGKGNITSDPSSPRSPRLATLVRSPSAHSLNVTLNDEAKFKKLNYWEQWDALCASMTEPDPNPVKLLLYFVGAALCAMNIFVVYTLTRWAFPGASFAEAFVKNLIAWTGLAYQNGFEMAIHLLTHNMGCRTKWKLGSIKLSSFGYDATKRRSPIDLAISLAFSLSRLYMIASPRPTAMCAWTYFLATAALAATDFGQFTASYGFLHGPWSVYMLAKYTGATGALALLQLQLIVMYVGCGVGKMGPWFTQVFNQEWTLPPWAAFLNLRPYLYGADFPRDITPSNLGTALGYAAACTEWIAPLAWLLPAGAFVGSTVSAPLVGVVTLPAGLATGILVSMHIYIVAHMPALDVWLLNVVPAILLPYAFHNAETLARAGFDYAGFASLPWPYQLASFALVAYALYGQLFPSRVTYCFAYRFWAGNWPQGYILLKKSALEKLYRRWPELAHTGPCGGISPSIEPDAWQRSALVYGLFGTFHNAQLPLRHVPLLMHQALGGQRLTDFDGVIAPSFFASWWLAGTAINDSHYDHAYWSEAHKECGFEAGEVRWISTRSFPLLAHLWGGRATYELHDAKLGRLSAGSISVAEALAVTRPSVLKFKGA